MNSDHVALRPASVAVVNPARDPSGPALTAVEEARERAVGWNFALSVLALEWAQLTMVPLFDMAFGMAQPFVAARNPSRTG